MTGICEGFQLFFLLFILLIFKSNDNNADNHETVWKFNSHYM